jgi:hypothetical protein
MNNIKLTAWSAYKCYKCDIKLLTGADGFYVEHQEGDSCRVYCQDCAAKNENKMIKSRFKKAFGVEYSRYKEEMELDKERGLRKQVKNLKSTIKRRDKTIGELQERLFNDGDGSIDSDVEGRLNREIARLHTIILSRNETIDRLSGMI